MRTALAFIFVFGLLTIFHELGHFLAAKRVGILVEEFGVGLGPQLWAHRWGETRYSVRLFPLGGFVRMLGEEEGTEESERSFRRQSVLSRLLVIGAGPVMNFVLAALLFALIFFVAGVPAAGTRIAGVVSGQPAAIAGLKAGDVIVGIDGEPVRTWEQVVSGISRRAGQETRITVRRAGRELTFSLVPRPAEGEGGRGVIGIQRVMERYRPFLSLYWGARQTVGTTLFILVRLGQMIMQRAPADVAGPVGIVQVVGEVARTGLINLLSLAGLLSVNLGLFNLFPIPLLDGGQLVIISWEGLRGEPLGPEREGLVKLIGVILLLAILVLATYQDLLRLGV
ncbi:MAG TPA: RIP metalloprotease RseP [Firmicutes bacterium]|nr:regulator of sigma protease [Bacillota bacterium]MDK2926582.1 regulator of sigma protease [Bacillota bacterium]HHV56173.1 RIP metalloprotease RseP [Bacillota bacterium]